MTSETFEMKQENKLGSQSTQIALQTITMEWTTKTPNHYAKI